MGGWAQVDSGFGEAGLAVQASSGGVLGWDGMNV